MNRKLHIGGKQVLPGWEIFNIMPGAGVDHVGDASDLSRFDDGIFEAIYASHVLEHFGYGDISRVVLPEWKRVLRPGGNLYVSVPDLDTLASLFLMKNLLNATQRFTIAHMMFGGQADDYDFHFAGLNYEFLSSFLKDAGYVNIRRVDKLGFFDDASSQTYGGFPVSVNVIAEKPLARAG